MTPQEMIKALRCCANVHKNAHECESCPCFENLELCRSLDAIVADYMEASEELIDALRKQVEKRPHVNKRQVDITKASSCSFEDSATIGTLDDLKKISLQHAKESLIVDFYNSNGDERNPISVMVYDDYIE